MFCVICFTDGLLSELVFRHLCLGLLWLVLGCGLLGWADYFWCFLILMFLCTRYVGFVRNYN